jgi:zinc protease
VAGTFDEERVLASVQAALATVRSGRPRQPCRPYRVASAREKQRHLRDRNAATSEISLAYPTVPSTHPDWFALNILADILGQGPNARLQARLVGKGLATQFGEGMTESPCAASLLRMRARVAPDVATAAVQGAIDEELTRLARDLVSPDELATAHAQERQWAAEQLSSVTSIANAAARAALFYGDPGRINTDVALMVAVSREDVRRVAQRYLRKATRAVVMSVAEAAGR